MKKLIFISMFIPLVCFGQTNQATAYAYYSNGMDKYNNKEYYQARQNFYEASKYYVWPQLKYAYGISLYLTGEKNNGCKYISEASSEGLTIGSDWIKACSENSQNNSNSYVDSENKYKRTYSNSDGDLPISDLKDKLLESMSNAVSSFQNLVDRYQKDAKNQTVEINEIRQKELQEFKDCIESYREFCVDFLNKYEKKPFKYYKDFNGDGFPSYEEFNCGNAG